MRGLDNPCTTLPGVEVYACVVPLADQQLLGQLGVVVVVGVLGHVAPAEYTWGNYGGQGDFLRFPGCVSPPVTGRPPLHAGHRQEQHHHQYAQDGLH